MKRHQNLGAARVLLGIHKLNDKDYVKIWIDPRSQHQNALGKEYSKFLRKPVIMQPFFEILAIL